MDPLITRCFFLLLALAGGCSAKKYRYDYEWNEQAGGWLKYHAVPATWDEARMRCHAEGATLASPLNNQLKRAIVEFVKRKSRDEPHIFTGVHALFSKGDYASIEGVPLLKLAINWEIGEPDNYDNSESCLVMASDENGTMADICCDRVMPYVCYKKDTWLSITPCGTSDPAYKLDSSTGSCYKLHTNSLVWRQAYMTCMAEGGYLAIVDNDTELQAVKNIFATASNIITKVPDQFMVGLSDWGQSGQSFMTIHGQDLDTVHKRWASGRPDSLRKADSSFSSSRQYSVNLYKRTGNLIESTTNIPLPFLCEKDPKSLV